MNKSLKETAAGYGVGAANIIPGVSGGTILLVLGLYERIIGALKNISRTDSLTAILHLLSFPFSPDRGRAAWQVLQKKDFPLLLRVLTGAFLAIITLSALMQYLLENQRVFTFALFFGLIAASIAVPLLRVRRTGIISIIVFCAGTASAVAVGAAGDPVEKARSKSAVYRQQAASEQTASALQQESALYAPADYLFIALSGALAISAMLLPGLSGSLILLVLGRYVAVITAVTRFMSTRNPQHLFFLGAMGIGMALGLFLFARVIDWVLHRYHDRTM
ncbi:MAG: DUF368 domain-containing protein, partial [Fibrobacterota bacterium]